MNKKILGFALFLGLLATLGACDTTGTGGDTTPTVSPVEPTVTPTTSP
ncbi:hypothetical protein IQ230_01435 [Gloeocapsopsis crepidinum LEGE 06123]|uniref:Beta-Ig-H3/fasciclin n=1 Tax=Gloeocapsopsis crepidinum LEGE 06123 TaxID=588587 RepID=A0ABR9UM02_9CHRO|nr:hypothetical protein [Gloeocapsopsis crepidinum]MBE9189050.1 hypothetical protein [Gloeocapsopsis crepidinum LEGE 06123]